MKKTTKNSQKAETPRERIIRKKQHILTSEKEYPVRVLLPEAEFNTLVEKARANGRVAGREASALLKNILNAPQN